MAWQASAIDLTPVSWAEGPDAIAGLAELLRDRTWTALTGAGASTDSGIPDYRGPTSVRATPMQYAEFVRSTVRPAALLGALLPRLGDGWATREPNDGHRALVDLESAGLVGVVTQNVDGLHTRAGSRTVVNLHGEIAWVVCLDCGDRTRRADVQRRLDRAESGPGRTAAGRARRAAAGRRCGGAGVADFVLADCAACGGRLKPDVVFFGESVPKDRVQTPTSWWTRARCWSCSVRRSR